MKRLGVFLLPPGWDASPSLGCPQNWIRRYPYTCIHLGGERQEESKVSDLTGRGKTLSAERRTQNAERRTQNAEFLCLLAVSFTCVCLRLASICWKGQHFIVFGPFQQIKANRKQTQVKLTASKQCIRHSAFGVRRSAFTPAVIWPQSPETATSLFFINNQRFIGFSHKQDWAVFTDERFCALMKHHVLLVIQARRYFSFRL